MSAPTKNVTKEDVIVICDQLQAEGVTPTSTRIRKQLGRGSLSTVVRYLKEWQAGSSPEASEALQIPAGLMSIVESFGRQAWEHAVGAAEEALNAEREKLAQQRVVWEREIDSAAALTDKAERQNAHLEREVELLRKELETRQKINTDLRIENNRVMSKNESLIESTETLTAQIDELQGTLSEKTTDLSVLQEKNERLTQDVDTFKTKIRSLESDLNKETRQVESARNELEKAIAENQSIVEQLANASEESISLATKLADTDRQRQLLEAECGHAETQISQLNERLEELRLDNKETLSRFEQAIEEKSVQSGRVLALSDQIGGYKAEIQELQTELLEYKAKSESNKPRAE
tara:strand:+ start:707 stop:1756 length:1050 start_codon:yes stop_codon:yes gene_type:complete